MLIKAVLQAMPIYYMSTTILPTQVTKTLNALIRRFFWGSGDKDRYMAYIAWDTIIKPKEVGGLAVRDLKTVNEALVLKSLWKLVTGSIAPWVQLTKAKYLPRSNIWSSKRTYNCTLFWRSLMKLREHLLTMIEWKIGDGQGCPVFGEPWFPEATSYRPALASDRNLKICDLADQTQGTWDTDRLAQLFDMQ